jgi:drug/metabolite transporter (DMT)-like permease
VRLTETGPAAAGFWRLAIAAPILAALAFRPGGDEARRPPPAALLAGVMFALDLGFWHYSIAYTSVAKATVLTNLTPVVVTVVAWLALGQRPRRLFVAAVALAVVGAGVMAADRHGAPGVRPALGDSLAVITTLWYAFYMLAIAQARRTAGAARVMFWSSLAAAPLLLAAALLLREEVIPASPAGWGACAGLGLMHVAGQGAIAWSLGRLPAATASVVVLIQPVVAALLGWLLFHEALGPWQALGAAMALTGIVLAQRAGTPERRPASTPLVRQSP